MFLPALAVPCLADVVHVLQPDPTRMGQPGPIQVIVAVLSHQDEAGRRLAELTGCGLPGLIGAQGRSPSVAPSAGRCLW